MPSHPTPGPERPETSTVAPRRRRSPGARYLMRFLPGIALYLLGLFGSIALAGHLDPAIRWTGGLLVVPGILVMTWAVLAYYAEADELERRKVGGGVLIAFAVGTPAVIAIGVMQAAGLTELSWIWAGVVYLAVWLVGTVVMNLRYR